jgi:hypothetical protein
LQLAHLALSVVVVVSSVIVVVLDVVVDAIVELCVHTQVFLCQPARGVQLMSPVVLNALAGSVICGF